MELLFGLLEIFTIIYLNSFAVDHLLLLLRTLSETANTLPCCLTTLLNYVPTSIMTLSSIEGSQPTHTEPSASEKTVDPERLQPEEEKAVKKGSVFKALGWLDRLLALWILLAMIIGILLGNFVEEAGPTLNKGRFVGVSIPVTIGLLVMMYPILCKVRFESLHHLFQTRALWVQVAFSVFMNWIVAPLLMVSIYLVRFRIQLTQCSSVLPGLSYLTTPTCDQD
jgi:hypothetical protein